MLGIGLNARPADELTGESITYSHRAIARQLAQLLKLSDCRLPTRVAEETLEALVVLISIDIRNLNRGREDGPPGDMTAVRRHVAPSSLR